MKSDVQRDERPSLPLTNDVMREEIEEDSAYEAWKSDLAPQFCAKLMACAVALVGREKAKEFYEEILSEAYFLSEEAPR